MSMFKGCFLCLINIDALETWHLHRLYGDFLQKRPKGPPYLGELHYFLIMITETLQNSKIWSQGSGYSLVFEHLPNVWMALGWVPQTHEETGRESEKRDGKEWEENGEQDRTETVRVIYVWVWYISLCVYKYVLSSWGLNPALLSKQSSTLSLAAWWCPETLDISVSGWAVSFSECYCWRNWQYGVPLASTVSRKLVKVYKGSVSSVFPTSQLKMVCPFTFSPWEWARGFIVRETCLSTRVEVRRGSVGACSLLPRGEFLGSNPDCQE